MAPKRGGLKTARTSARMEAAATQNEVTDVRAAISQIMDTQPAAINHLKQTLIELGLWPSTPSSSSDPPASDDSAAAGDRPTSSEERRHTSTSSPWEAEAWGGDSDDSGRAQVELAKHSEGSLTATGGSGGASASTGFSGGRAASGSGGPPEDGDSTGSSAERKGPQASDSSERAVAGSSAGAWRYSEAAGQASSYDASNESAKATEDGGSDSSAKVKDGENSHDSGKRPIPDLPDLPADAFVWMEGEDVREEISSLTKGSRVLCFDSLGRTVRYAEVEDVRHDEESVQWVAVELSDGTKTIIAADHLAQDSGGRARIRAERAERSAGSKSAAGGSAGAAESSSSSGGRAASISGSPLEDGDGTDTSAEQKEAAGQASSCDGSNESAKAREDEGSDSPTKARNGGGQAEVWLYKEAAGHASSCDRSNETEKAEEDEPSDSSAKFKDGASSDDSGKRRTPDLPVHSMDCLPTDAVVWVEGEDVPREISSLSKGSRVLCFDSLSRSVRYAEVVDVRQDEEPVQWVAVELWDGTKTILTADHPVQLVGKPPLQDVVKARDIEPQNSQIMVHRVTTAPVHVRSVVALPPGLVLPSGRVSVTVQQPDRHAVLVASPEQGHADARFVAVGSADLAPQPLGMLGAFSCTAKLLASPKDARQRSHSWPPGVGSSSASSRLQLPPPMEHVFKLASSQARSSSSDAAQEASSVSESGSETSSGGDMLVLLPWNLPGRPAFRAAMQGAAAVPYPGRIGALLQARADNLPSVGSVGHATATCKPCSFVRRGRCVGGVWCPHCHGEHRKSNGKLFAVDPSKASSSSGPPQG